eukprot:jgi/Ulvmu1/2662/UM014_0118.1
MLNLQSRTISDKQFEYLRAHSVQYSLRDKVAKVMGLPDDKEPRNRIVLDLYMAVLSFCARSKFDDIKCSTCMGIIRTIHTTAMKQRQHLQACCKHFNELMLQHSVHRPPWSMSILSMADIKLFSSFVHAHYFCNFAYFKYAFTPAVTLSFRAVDPRSWFEVPGPMPPLVDAADEALHEQQRAELAANLEAEKAAEAAKVAEEAEIARQAAIDQEYRSAKPMDIEAQVERIVVEQLTHLRQEVSQEYMAEISKLKADIHNLRHN